MSQAPAKTPLRESICPDEIGLALARLELGATRPRIPEPPVGRTVSGRVRPAGGAFVAGGTPSTLPAVRDLGLLLDQALLDELVPIERPPRTPPIGPVYFEPRNAVPARRWASEVIEPPPFLLEPPIPRGSPPIRGRVLSRLRRSTHPSHRPNGHHTRV